MENVLLIIVDAQHDFCNPSGSLYVPGAEKAVEKITELIRENLVTDIIFTVDWHPNNHCSFSENGGPWPAHCIEYSKGAAIEQSILDAVKDLKIPYRVVEKGCKDYLEEYGAFSGFSDQMEIAEKFGEHEVIVCGVAGEFCVMSTLDNLNEFLVTDKLSVYLPGVASIDGGEKIKNYIDKNKIKEFTL